MARRLNKFVSIVLSSALVVLSAGFDAQRAAAGAHALGRTGNSVQAFGLGPRFYSDISAG